ncbi:aspartate/glutamate racemase family protein [Endozoicomonas sp. GU-1]|uniref:aspartate/glutamate racemase family protein n=1 Tax=Endozoicomonas sp. GU-1 TaxID=3009078 RepID=UPI0022B4FD16|nr:aspartate/glutamate racemase family protein [Endozoicomonas sp. GU-1]WBA80125.1 aspartate/glutamate racemase family protein [Endozoicomonas sp. GU-1]
MKTIGLIGGMSWESTLSYYKGINKGVKTSLGGLHSAKVALYSVDFAEIEKLQHQGEWDKTAEILSAAARSVEAGGADFFLICTNTMHKVAEAVEKSVAIPLVHIADATGELLVKDGIKRVGLLGTRFTMEQAFYKNRLSDKFGIDVVIPDEAEREVVHQVMYTELCLGQTNSASRNQYLKIISSLHNQGAEAVILGCTEIALLVQQTQTAIPLYDTTEIHAQKAVKLAIGE